MTQVLYWVVLVIAASIAIFAVQNSDAPPVIIKFLLWKFETSLVYMVLGSIVLGAFFALLFWIPRAIKTSIKKKDQPKETGTT